MNKDTFNRLDLELYSKTLKNGLKVFIVPFKNVNNVYATFSTNYGSVNREFVPINETKMSVFPDGIAHFLEHKLFEQKDGIDPFTFYSERGSDANANTSNFKTTYLFSGTQFLEENLNFLLDYVQEPYFTDENVEKEKGIIEQEIQMYQDDPYSLVYEKLIYNTFINHPVKYPVIGTIESINKITKEDLYTCYNTFYNPSNMVLVITGNVDESIIDIIEKNQNSKEFDKEKEISIKKYDEPCKVFKEYEEFTKDVALPKVGIAFKIKNDLKISKRKVNLYLSILFELLYGTTSLLAEQLKDDNIINDYLSLGLIEVDDFVVEMLIGETKEYKVLIEKVRNEIKNINVTEEDIERAKKVCISSIISASDDIYSINHKIIGNVMKYNKVLTNDYDEIRSLNLEEFNDVISKLSFDNITSCVITKK